jgi:hypothetical protein
MASSLRDAALAYRRRGWSVLPIVPATKKPPKDFRWAEYQKRLPTEEEIEQWWRDRPNLGVGIITGKVSNLIVLDVDTNKGADANSVYEQYPTGVVSRTGSGGGHFFYQYPKDRDHVPNVVGRENGRPNGLDLRADGGYVVAPPTLHPSGRRYRWIENDRPKAMPTPLLSRVLQHTEKSKDGGTVEPWLADVLAGVDEGGRNDASARLAGYYFKKGMPADVVLQHLTLWNQQNPKPLSAGRLKLTVESIQRTRQRQQREEPVSGARDLEDTSSELFQLMSLHQYMASFGSTETDWIVENWLPDQTIAMIVSPPGTYKTWILLDLAVSLATATPFLSIAPVRKSGPVLIVQQEDFHGSIAERMAVILAQRFRMGASANGGPENFSVTLPPNPPIYLHPNRELRFGNPEAMDALEARIDELKPIAVIGDPLYTMVDMKSGDFMASAVDDMLRLKLMRDRYRCSFVLAHHTAKRAQDSQREDLWGSQFLNAYLETGWQIRPKSTNSAVIRRHFKVAKNIEESVLSFDIQTDQQPTHYRPSLMAADDAADTTSAAILKLLVTEPQVTQATMAKMLDADKSTISRALRKLVADDLIRMDLQNRYSLSDTFNVKGDS